MGAEVKPHTIGALAEKVRDRHVFISGPMTGIDHNNAPQFVVAHELLKRAGALWIYDPVIEWLNERTLDGKDLTHEQYMRRCIRELSRERGVNLNHYDVLALLPGWQVSDGAYAEYEVARACGIECVELERYMVADSQPGCGHAGCTRGQRRPGPATASLRRMLTFGKVPFECGWYVGDGRRINTDSVTTFHSPNARCIIAEEENDGALMVEFEATELLELLGIIPRKVEGGGAE